MTAIGQSALTLADFTEIHSGKAPVTLDAAALEKVAVNFRFLQTFSEGKLIYGINTGFGPMAQYKVSDENLIQLQYNLIRSHSSGSGKILPASLGRALLIARLNSLMQGYSGVHPEAVELMKELINRDISPCTYEHGGVGASGDLVQLAHLALTLIGEGEVLYQGQIRPTAELFAELHIKPLSIHMREGLAILNGTSAMTGIGMLNIIQARKLLGWGVILSSLTNEIMEAFDDH
jgi:histidine ammonia-lyase